MDKIGFGKFQIKLLLASGLSWVSLNNLSCIYATGRISGFNIILVIEPNLRSEGSGNPALHLLQIQQQ